MCPTAFAPARPWVTLLAVCLFLPPGVRAEDPAQEKVTVRIRPVVLFAGGDVRTTVRTPRHPSNRALRVVVEGADYFASSDVQLDGVDSATTHQFVWKELPGGPYRVDAILLREDGDKTTVTECFAVLGGEESETGVGASNFPTRRRQQRASAPPESAGVKAGC
jgi:hypothetical protein